MRSIAIQGTIGSYSEEAAIALFGSDVKIKGFRSFFETFQALLMNAADYAVIPVRNTIIGEISSATSLYSQTDLDVLDEFPLEIRHVLVGTENACFDEIRSVRSHVAALKQCAGFFEKHQHIERIVGADTASSIRRIVSDGMNEMAAIGSPRAAAIFGGKILSEGISDQTNNQTTFHVIGK